MNSFRFRSSHDSALGSHPTSMDIPNSQPCSFSQISTQDMFSQLPSNVTSQSQNSQEKTSRPSMYEKWLSHKSSVKRETLGTGSKDPKSWNSTTVPRSHNDILFKTSHAPSSQFSHQQTMQIKAAEEREERLEQFVCTFQECNNEILSHLGNIRKELEGKDKDVQQQCLSWMKSFSEDVWKQEERILEAIKQQNTEQSSNQETEVILAKKNSKIDFLTNQLEQVKQENMKGIENILMKTLKSPQQTLQKTLKELSQVTKDSKDKQMQGMLDLCNQVAKQGEEVSDLHRIQIQSFKEFEKRSNSESQKQYREILRKLSAQRKEDLRDFKSSVQGQIEHFNNDIQLSLTDMSESIKDFNLKEHQSMISALLREETNGLKQSIEANLYHQFDEVRNQLHTICNKVKILEQQRNTFSQDCRDSVNLYSSRNNYSRRESDDRTKAFSSVRSICEMQNRLRPPNETLPFKAVPTPTKSTPALKSVQDIDDLIRYQCGSSKSVTTYHAKSHVLGNLDLPINGYSRHHDLCASSQSNKKRMGPSPVAAVLPQRQSTNSSVKSVCNVKTRQQKVPLQRESKKIQRSRPERRSSAVQAELKMVMQNTLFNPNGSSNIRKDRKRKSTAPDRIVKSPQKNQEKERTTGWESPKSSFDNLDTSCESTPSVSSRFFSIQRKVRTPFSQYQNGNRVLSSRPRNPGLMTTMYPSVPKPSPARTMLSMSDM